MKKPDVRSFLKAIIRISESMRSTNSNTAIKMSASQIKDFLKDIQLHNIFLQLNILDSLFQLIIKVAIALRKKNGL